MVESECLSRCRNVIVRTRTALKGRPRDQDVSFTSVAQGNSFQKALFLSAGSEECVDAKSSVLEELARYTGQGGVAFEMPMEWIEKLH